MSSGEFQGEFEPKPAMAKRGRFSVNLAWNLANFALNILVGIWFVPYLIRYIGVAAYGLIPLINQLTGYLQIITLSVNAAVGRFLTIALEQHDDDRANRIFNTAFFAVLMLGLTLIIPSSILVYQAPNIFHVPPGMEGQARLLFLFAIGGFMANEITLPWGISMFCRNRFDLQNIINVIGTAVRLLVVIALFSVVQAKLWHVGLATFISFLISAIGAVIAHKILTPNLKLSVASFDRTMLKELTTTGGWVVLNQIGTLLFLSIDLILVNRMFGADSAGRYSVVLQWSILLRGLAGTMAGIFGPNVIQYYARRDYDGMVVYVSRAIKFLGLVMALPIGLICGLSKPILNVWLGPEFTAQASLMSLMTIHLCVNLAVLPLFNVQQATNKVKWPGITMIITGVLNVFLAWTLAAPVGWGLYGIAGAGAIVLTLKNAIFTPIYNSAIIGRNWKTFFPPMALVTAITLVVTAVSRALSGLVHGSAISSLLLIGLVITVVYGFAVYFFILDPSERGRIDSKLNVRKAVLDPETALSKVSKSRSKWRTLFLALALINIVIFGRDMLDRLDTRFARRKNAGSLSDRDYMRLVERAAIDSLNSPTPLPADDDPHFLILKDISGLRASPLEFSWPEAMLAKGIVLADRSTRSSEALDALKSYCDRIVKPNGDLTVPLLSLDQTSIGETLIYLTQRTNEKKYLMSAAKMASFLVGESQRQGGPIAYRPENSKVRLVDTIGMICPFLYAYGSKNEEPSARQLAVTQLTDFINYGLEPRFGLPYHGYNPDLGYAPIGVVGWGRGAGWFAVGLIDTLVQLPVSDESRLGFQRVARRFAESVIKCQMRSGAWGAMLNTGSSEDTSATAMLAYFLEKCGQLRLLDQSVFHNVDMAIEFLKKSTRLDGTVDFSQGNLMYYNRHSMSFRPTPIAQGMTLALMAERLHRGS